MVAADVTNYIETFLPNCEVVVLTASDGETYSCRKIGTILGASATGNNDVDAHLNVTFSGGTATINYASQTDKVVTLTLWGTP